MGRRHEGDRVEREKVKDVPKILRRCYVLFSDPLCRYAIPLEEGDARLAATSK